MATGLTTEEATNVVGDEGMVGDDGTNNAVINVGDAAHDLLMMHNQRVRNLAITRRNIERKYLIDRHRYHLDIIKRCTIAIRLHRGNQNRGYVLNLMSRLAASRRKADNIMAHNLQQGGQGQ